jgi:hypothetical protein
MAVTAGVPATAGGTAADAGGGRVGGVEVSVDGGASWHPADGRETWTYTWTPSTSGTITVQSRAVDDSANLEGRDGGDAGGTNSASPGTTAGGAATAESPPDRLAPRIGVRRHRLRASRGGVVALRLRCPSAEQSCRVDVRLRRHGATLAAKKLTVAGGKTRRATLRLNRVARRLLRSHALNVTAVVTARDAAGNRAVTRTQIRLLTPRRTR